MRTAHCCQAYHARKPNVSHGNKHSYTLLNTESTNTKKIIHDCERQRQLKQGSSIWQLEGAAQWSAPLSLWKSVRYLSSLSLLPTRISTMGLVLFGLATNTYTTTCPCLPGGQNTYASCYKRHSCRPARKIRLPSLG